MWTKTEVDKWRAVDVVDAHEVACLLLDQFTLQRLVAYAEHTQRFVFGNLLTSITKVLARDLLHPFFDDGQIGFRKRLRRDHVVEEAVTWIVKQRWSDAEFGFGKEIKHCRSQQVGGGMTQDFEPVARLRDDRFDLNGFAIATANGIELGRKVHLTTTDLRS